MSELEEKLNSILSSPAEMEKIMGLARELSGSLGARQDTPQGGEPQAHEQAKSPDGPDARTLRIVSRVMAEYSSQSGDKSALLSAMKPYLREERRAAVDRAAEIAKLTHAARAVLAELGKGDR